MIFWSNKICLQDFIIYTYGIVQSYLIARIYIYCSANAISDAHEWSFIIFQFESNFKNYRKFLKIHDCASYNKLPPLSSIYCYRSVIKVNYFSRNMFADQGDETSIGMGNFYVLSWSARSPHIHTEWKLERIGNLLKQKINSIISSDFRTNAQSLFIWRRYLRVIMLFAAKQSIGTLQINTF